MLKNVKGGDIIIFEVKFQMARDEFLLSTAMLSSIWEDDFSDSIDLLIGFVKYVIGQSTKVDDYLDLKSIHASAKKYLYIPNIPEQIIEEILHRLTKRRYDCILSYDDEQAKYILKSDLTDFVAKFDEKKNKQQLEISAVFNKLDTFYNNKARKQLSQEELKKNFFRFLSQEGFDFLRSSDTPNSLRKITSDSGQCFYLIAQFILDLYENDKDAYNTVLKITTGYFLSKSIYLDSNKNYYKKNPPLKDLKVYIDTTLLLYILDCKTEYQHQSAMSMIKLLIDNGASLFYYPHNLEEVQDIIEKYKRNRQHKNPRKTLEKFDEENYSDIQIDLFFQTISEKLKANNIEIANTHSYDDYNNVIDEKALGDYLAENIAGYKGKGEILEHDIESISSICRERNGIKTNEYENLSCIWVTSNTKLVKYTNKFFGKEYKNSFSPIISDRKITTDLWIRYGKKKDNVFELFLLENALLAIEPSEEVVSKFIEYVDKFEEMNAITPETAAYVRIRCINDKQIMISTDGDPEKMTEQTANDLITEFKEKIIDDYKKEQERELDHIQSKYEAEGKLKDEELARQKADNTKKDKYIKDLEDKIQQSKETEEKELKALDSKASNSAKKVCKVLTITVRVLLIALAAIFVGKSVYDIIEIINGNGGIMNFIASLIVALINIALLVFDFFGIFAFIKGIKQKIFYSIKSRFYKRYLKQYNKFHIT